MKICAALRTVRGDETQQPLCAERHDGMERGCNSPGNLEEKVYTYNLPPWKPESFVLCFRLSLRSLFTVY